MTKRKVLKDPEALHLGLKLNQEKRYALNAEQYEKLYIFQGYDPALAKECSETGISPEKVNHYWHKSEHFSLHLQEEKNEETMGEFRTQLIEDLKKYSPSFKKIKRTKSKDNHCLVLDPADIHVGKLATDYETGDAYNSNIAVQRVKEGVQGILDKSSGFNIDKICFIGGNDILHTDSPKRQTTSGTPQDTDGMWYENFLVAKQLYIDVLETLISVADVHFVFNPSNHDYVNGFFLANVIETHFRNCKNITFDCSIAHRKYFTYGNSLIGSTHGDGAKQVDLGQLMSVEAKKYWADMNYRYFYTHHVHHKTSKDYINVTVESLRSPSGADSWHNRNGYVSEQNKAIEGFIHSKTAGQIARFTHYF